LGVKGGLAKAGWVSGAFPSSGALGENCVSLAGSRPRNLVILRHHYVLDASLAGNQL